MSVSTDVPGGLGVSFSVSLLSLVGVGMDRDSLVGSDEAEDCEGKGLLHIS